MVITSARSTFSTLSLSLSNPSCYLKSTDRLYILVTATTLFDVKPACKIRQWNLIRGRVAQLVLMQQPRYEDKLNLWGPRGQPALSLSRVDAVLNGCEDEQSCWGQRVQPGCSLKQALVAKITTNAHWGRNLWSCCVLRTSSNMCHPAGLIRDAPFRGDNHY